MKKNWVVLISFITLPVFGQRNADYGVSVGVSSYLGDINPNKLLYSPLPAASFFYRLNLNPRQALRANAFLGGLSGNDLDFDNEYQQTRAMSFSSMVAEAVVQFEFNFFPYTTEGKLYDYSPYIAAGAGAAFNLDTGFVPVIPFSFGFKINLLKNMGLEAEYGFRKTFYDNFDGLNDFVAPSDYALAHNNDWYTFTGISLTWKIVGRLAGCAVYDDADSKRKH
ncbi:MAG TPA: DUF6089 family protein [Bacteroidales bacterium]|nr:DUF6089 family protein [Bacteroidales bacterium]